MDREEVAVETSVLNIPEEYASIETEATSLRKSNQLNKPTQSSFGLKGPLKVFRLCMFSIILPGLLIAAPLYLRYHVYGDQLYPLAMSDMRLLDNKVSTTWCQRQLVKVNTTFNAFLIPEKPTVSQELQHLSMVRNLQLEDDMKEYWGFYLLKGSSVTVSTCVRWPGASLIVIRGHKHLHECAYIGDDSSEELDEIMEALQEKGITDNQISEDAPSNVPEMMKRHRESVHFHHPKHNDDLQNYTLGNEQEVEDHITDPKIMNTLLGQLLMKTKDRLKLQSKDEPSSKKDHVHKRRDQTVNQDEEKYLTFEDAKSNNNSDEVFQNILKKLQKLGDRGQKVLEKLNDELSNNRDEDRKIKDMLGQVINDQEIVRTRGRQWNKQRVLYEDAIDEANRKKRDLILSTAMRKDLNEDDEEGNAGAEEGFIPDGVADHHEIINDTTLNDRSNSEFWSSFSSSEEALLNCAGLILNLPLSPHRKCEIHRTTEDLEEASLTNTVTYRVPSNGYYFFVFNSENEVQKNYIRVHFYLRKAVYDISNYVAKCSNSTECALDLNFFSDEKLIVELPVKNNETLWNQEFVVLSECEPRTSLYIICVVSVPLAIVLFAFQ